MFDFGFTELMFIALVALIVVGPKRLPKVARTAGHLLGRLQRYVSDVKSDISREMQIEDLKKLQQQVEQQARDLEKTVRNEVGKVEGDLKKSTAEIEHSIAAPPSSPAVPAAARPPMPDTAAPAALPVHDNQLPLGLEAEPARQAADKT